MSYPEYRYIHKHMKCPKKRINICIKSTYKYNFKNDMYELIERTCDIESGHNTKFKCNGTNEYGQPCYIINPPLLQLSPESPDFD